LGAAGTKLLCINTASTRHITLTPNAYIDDDHMVYFHMAIWFENNPGAMTVEEKAITHQEGTEA
jgi:hypothetical protein